MPVLPVQILTNSSTSVSAALRDSQQQLQDALKNRQLQVSLTSIMRQRARLATSRHHLTRRFIKHFDNEVGMLSYTLTRVGGKWLNTTVGACKSQKKLRNRTAKLSGRKRADRILLILCFLELVSW